MKKIVITIVLSISPILAQCDWNEDNQVDVLDVVATVDCIMSDCWSVDPCTDYDGNTYETIQLGDQVWMAENLRVTHYNNGDEIPTVWPSNEGAYAVYNDDPANVEIYGNLYNWWAVDDSRSICPEGFHIPSDVEWMELEIHQEMDNCQAYDTGWRGFNEGSELSGNIDLWINGALENNEEFGTSGFGILPAGYRINSGSYHNIWGDAYLWSSSENDYNNSWRRYFNFDNTGINRNASDKRNGFSVRCVGD
jgi:uncharacterized protein (TIGR02145 family)